MIDLINSRTESQTTMEYNAQGRLCKISIDTFTNGVKSQSIVQEYAYNSSGLKIRQVESVDANADGVIDGQSITNYLNEALNHTGYAQVLEERKIENGQPVKVTTYNIGHDVLAQFDSVNGYLALMADGHGSTRGVANGLGQMVQQYSYDAYGNAVGFDPAGAYTNLLYSGEQFNPASGLQYLRARWYNPTNGRFNRLDPYFGDQESPLSFHKYAYANMNPVMNIDPAGLTGTAIELDAVTAIINILQRAASSALGFFSRMMTSSVSIVRPLLQPGVLNAAITASRGAVAVGVNLSFNELLLAIYGALVLAAIKAMPNKVFPVVEMFYPAVYDHHVRAIQTKGYTTVLTFNGFGSSQTTKNRSEAMAQVPIMPLYHRDEYPYASTAEGGGNSNVVWVDPFDNMSHGGSLRWFYTLVSPGERFFVMLVPTKLRRPGSLGMIVPKGM